VTLATIFTVKILMFTFKVDPDEALPTNYGQHIKELTPKNYICHD
jgi:hypothetical protein